MGVLGLRRYIRDHNLSVHLSVRLTKGCYLPVAIDTWNVMFPLLRRVDADGTMDPDDRTVRCLIALFAALNRRSYFPIFVFDGGCHKTWSDSSGVEPKTAGGAKAILLRSEEMAAAGSGRLKAQVGAAMMAAAGSNPVVDRRVGNNPNSPPHYRLCQELIRAAGYATVCVPGMEADDACANLFHTHTVSYVYSYDTDLLLMGCDVITDLSPAFPLAVLCDDLLRHLNMSHEQFLSTFVDCHTNLHGSDCARPFAARLAEYRRNSQDSPPPSPGDEWRGDEDSDAETLAQPRDGRKDDDEDGDYCTHCNAGGAEKARGSDNKLADLKPVPSHKRFTSVLSAFPEDDDKPDPSDQLERDEPAVVPALTRRLKETRNREFISYVHSITHPVNINGRLQLIKRVPVEQGELDLDEVLDVFTRYNRKRAWGWFCEFRQKGRCKPLPPLHKVLINDLVRT